MAKSLLFIPDISGYTQFIHSTEIEHSSHVIAEILEVLLKSNNIGLKLAEVEGDALFLYKEGPLPSQEQLLAQIERMFTAFHSHLKLIDKNRVCPCNACASAPNLELKIIAHAGDFQFIEVQGNKKPFGKDVIQAHRLLKNQVESNNYVLISKSLSDEIGLTTSYKSKIFEFKNGSDFFDSETVEYHFSSIKPDLLSLESYSEPQKVAFNKEALITIKRKFPISANLLLEYITNYKYRHQWVKGVERFDYNINEVTRLGTEHVCVVDGKILNFVTITKDVQANQLVYGELTSDAPVDELYQFYVISPINDHSCELRTEVYVNNKSIIKRLFVLLIGKRLLTKKINENLDLLQQFIRGNSLNLNMN